MKHFVISLLIAFCIGACAMAQKANEPPLVVKADMIYPEGIAYNQKTSEFYISSLRKGTIGTVSSTGQYSEFSSDRDLISTVGLWADMTGDRLIACVSDPGVSVRTSSATKEKLARVVVFNLTTKKKLKTIDLGRMKAGKHFCNDLTTDKEGNIYVTDSFSPVIYKIDPQYKASIFLESDKFKGEGFNLNGIVYHPSGYLLVAKYNDGTLFKVPVGDPKSHAQVQLNMPLPMLDGLVFVDNDEIMGIQNGTENKVHRFRTHDDWKTAATVQSTASQMRFPTTGVNASGRLHVLEGKLDELFANPKTAVSSEYQIKGFKL